MGITRRNMIVGTAVAFPIAACGASALPTPAGSDPVWDRLYALYRAAEVEEAERLRVFSALDDAWATIRATREPEPTTPSLGPIDKSLPLSALIEQTDAPEWKATWADYEADKAGWKARDDAAYAAHVGDTGDRYEAASDVCSASADALIAHPVATLGALAQKAELITTRYGDIVDGDDAKALIADIRRLAGREA